MDDICENETENVSNLDISFAMVKAPAVKRGVSPGVARMIEAAGLTIADRMIGHVMTDEQAKSLLRSHEGRDYYQWLYDQLMSGPVDAYLVTGNNAAVRLRTLVGPTKPEVAREEAPTSIRAVLTAPDESFARSRGEQRAVDNTAHCPDPADGSEKIMEEIAIFFPDAFAGHVL